MGKIRQRRKSLRELLNNRNLDSEFIANITNGIKPRLYRYRPSGTVEAFALICRANKILLHYDPDVDGLFSGELMQILLKFIHKDFECVVNDNRFHGIHRNRLDYIEQGGFDLVLCVDFTPEPQIIEHLTTKGIGVVSIDHHAPYDIPQFGNLYALVNNQYMSENTINSVKTLSGAGVVYYFIAECLTLLSKQTGVKWFENPDYIVPVGISLLSDSRDIENELCRYFLYRTYNEYQDTLFSDLVLDLKTGDFAFGTPKIDRNFVDFEFSPTINALFRFNMGTEVIDAFNTGIFTAKLKEYRNKQKKLIKIANEHIRVTQLSNMVVCELLKEDLIDKIDFEFNLENFVGLVASRVKDYYQKTALVYCRSTQQGYRGSVRGLNTKFNYLEIFQKYFSAHGHTMAFGAYFDTLGDIDKLNEDLKHLEPTFVPYEHMEIYNLKTFVSHPSESIARLVAEVNMYLKSDKQILLSYNGTGLTEKAKYGEMTEYLVDGIPARGFGFTNTGLIHPVITRGYLQFLVV